MLTERILLDSGNANFFAGIGGWPLAIRLSSWPTDAEVWTGSCPCQAFSSAGRLRGVGDERHLWPFFRNLIAERKPATCFGEQVASGSGLLWLTGVRTDLEELGYAVGAADLPAACVQSPQIRQRLFWVADAGSQRRNPLIDEGDIKRGEHITRTYSDFALVSLFFPTEQDAGLAPEFVCWLMGYPQNWKDASPS